MVIVKLAKSPSLANWVMLDVLIIPKSTLYSAVTLVSLKPPVLFSVEFVIATLVNVPFVKSLTTTQTEALSPLLSLEMVQTIFWPIFVKVPFAFTNSNAGFKSSIIWTLVALLGPWLVTVIVKLTNSPTAIVEVTLTDFTKVRLTLELTVMFVWLKPPVLFSVELARAILVNVPFVKSLTTTQTETLDPLPNFEMVQTNFWDCLV